MVAAAPALSMLLYNTHGTHGLWKAGSAHGSIVDVRLAFAAMPLISLNERSGDDVFVAETPHLQER
jgi:hypothetical protein